MTSGSPVGALEEILGRVACCSNHVSSSGKVARTFKIFAAVEAEHSASTTRRRGSARSLIGPQR